VKQIDRFLLAIIAGIVVLVAIALGLALARPAQGYLQETTPGAVAHNYLLAIKERDDERAYGSLSPQLSGYPADVEAFADQLDRYSWSFSRDPATISIRDERITDDRAVVTIDETRFYGGGLFSSGQSTNSFDVDLRREGEAWKIVDAGSYWAQCWSEEEGCE
jgi:hypothetical protein